MKKSPYLSAKDFKYNRAEYTVWKHLNDRGFKVVRHGWPDFIAFNEETGSIQFIEVKWVGEELRPSQVQTIRLLQQRGIYPKIARVKDTLTDTVVDSINVEQSSYQGDSRERDKSLDPNRVLVQGKWRKPKPFPIDPAKGSDRMGKSL